jgi:hypothetical protein
VEKLRKAVQGWERQSTVATTAHETALYLSCDARGP